jgi:cytochrome oxidase assembly protein ShyY1
VPDRADRRADYGFARRPAWIAGHLLAGSMLVLFVAAGVWQLDRLDQRRDRNELVEARSGAEPVDVGEVLDPDSSPAEVDELRFAAVTATGTYAGEPVVVRVTQDGLSGGRVFSPIVLDGGEQVLVLRGFVPQGPDGAVAAPPAPEGEVTVAGLAVPIRRLEAVTRRALDDVTIEAEAGLLRVVVQATTADSPELQVVPPPELGEGPHLAYAVQWFLFAGVVAVGYPLLLRRRARQAGP